VALAVRAIELDGRNALAHATCGHLKSFLFHNYHGALMHFDRALAASPNHALAWLLSSPTLTYLGRPAEAIVRAERALRLSPFERNSLYCYAYLGLAHYVANNYEEAVKWASIADGENPAFTANLRFLAASLAALERLEEAHDVAARLMKLQPEFRLDEWSRTGQPFEAPEMKQKYLRHLRKAGLAE
jgi:adenylate cyclase